MALLLAEKASCRGVAQLQGPHQQRRCAPFRSASKRMPQPCQCSSSTGQDAAVIDRRAVLLGASTVAAAMALQGTALAEGTCRARIQSCATISVYQRKHPLRFKAVTNQSQSPVHSGELGESKVFWGLARPPTSYGAYAGGDEKNAK